MPKSKFRKKIEKNIAMFFDKVMGSGLAQDENTADGKRYITPGMPEKVRELASEGIVLLKNDGGLPITEGRKVSVFGRVQHDWFYVGYGSGGDVHPPYEISFFEGLKNAGISYNEKLKTVYDSWCGLEENEADHGYWGHWPYFYEEMPLTDQLVEEAKRESDVAMVIIGRAAGEDRENKLEEGSYYLTATEKDMLSRVTKAFDKTILIMDCGNVIDLSFTEDYRLSAIVYAWQLGQENANALGNVLSGKVSPSGKLSDTIARNYKDYPSADNFGGKEYNDYAEEIYVGYRHFVSLAPEKILYPFGFGLSYTTFGIKAERASDAGVKCTVTNTGNFPGKEVVQVYVEAPEGKLKKSKKVLVGYGKTKLLSPGESCEVTVSFDRENFASFDEEGVTGFKNAFVLEAGEYKVFAGTDCIRSEKIYSFEVPENTCVEQCLDISEATRRERILADLPKEIAQTGDRGIKLVDVKNGKHTMEEFIAQLSDEELCDIGRGEGAMGSALGTEGNAGAYGGITEALRGKGIPPIITADGPAGLRVRRFTTLLPCGTAIACSFNEALIEEVFELIGQEAMHFGIDVNLAPGMNIHRNPLCGRNFEYYSEDPFLSGHVAAAVVRGIQKGGAVACPKHFACNNQEFNRSHNDSRVSEQALREIYLKNFEYCVKLGNPGNIMTSYNKVNGVWSHYNYDLVTTVLRKEWGYEGNVITDWWMRKAVSPEFPGIKDNAYRIRAQVDVLMPGNMTPVNQKYKFDRDLFDSLRSEDGITRAELQRTAVNVCKFAITRM
ncbi:glycoside hydrolase family 3 protein [Butyrivibrio sp. FCS014]|uniref:glycoside hydrolase family 3 protein n=1 Tax=Butyrivibrio sp. FCS014 TaxID=1408304 RepID=UPI000467A836|nr:glycoside hydrolase family 3 protein [Butyrivibrio sp. FCS014]